MHAFIICWTGMEENARAIAEAIVDDAEFLTVIYSNNQESDTTGPGTWIRVPDAWFYGMKFRECLRLHRSGIMLQIQADANSADWGKVLRNCRQAHADHAMLGIWGPDLDYTPWNIDIAKTGDLEKGRLALVAQTDGIVWSLSEQILARLGELDYECNNIGWGIDWIAIAYARCHNLLVARDLSITIQHPSGTAYSRDLATEQMQAFLAQMTAQEADQYMLLNSFIGQRVSQVRNVVTAHSAPLVSAANESAGGDTVQLKDWPTLRASSLQGRLRAMLDKQEILYSFVSGIPGEIFRYFPENIDGELATWTPEPFSFVPFATGDASRAPDLVIFTAHSNDLHLRLWEIREQHGMDPVIVVWFWDNHTAYLNNKATALAADLIIPSHSCAVDYLFNPASVVSGQVPLCCAQWSRAEAEHLFARFGGGERKSRLLVNYVKYDYASERNAVIQEIAESIPEADVLLMPSNDRSRYFSGTTDRRFEEWASYKATIILPVTEDLSTRFFDALVAGLIPIVPSCITDLDRICPSAALEALGVVRINSYDIGVIKAAAREALERFDAMGPAGVLARHRFALEHHMLVNRVTSILQTVYMNASGELTVDFGAGTYGAALYQVSNSCSI